MQGIKRNLMSKATTMLGIFPAIVVLGARQTGKTTLAKQLGPNWTYIDLEKPSDFERVSQDPEFFFKQYPSHVIIDEAQCYPVIFQILRGVIDQNRNQKGRFIISGSSSPELLKQTSESLAGRVGLLELGTLKANEYYQKPLSPFYALLESPLSLANVQNLLHGTSPFTSEQMQTPWIKGGYPEPVLTLNDAFYQSWMQAYHHTYINRDIAALFPRLNKIAYQRFITILCKFSGNILNKSDFAHALEVSQKTVHDYLGIAEGTFMWRSLPSFEGNTLKSTVRMPKGHVRDTGLMHYFLNINSFQSLYESLFMGHSFEAFVTEEILKGIEASTIGHCESYYYRTRDGAEIDLILEGPFGCLPIEVKCGVQIRAKQLSALNRFIQELKLPFGIVINQSDELRWLTPTILQLPVGWL